MNHPAFREVLLAERARELENITRQAHMKQPRHEPPAREDIRVALRLCTVHDGPALERLAKLEGRPLPHGCFVVAEIDGALVAAQPLDGGPALADSFQPTAHVLRLLRLRARQLEAGQGRRRVLARSWNAVRGF